jgi:hypothetical protein
MKLAPAGIGTESCTPSAWLVSELLLTCSSYVSCWVEATGSGESWKVDSRTCGAAQTGVLAPQASNATASARRTGHT